MITDIKKLISNKKGQNIMKKKLEKINFIGAHNGKLELHMGDKIKSSANPIILADIMSKHGFADVVMGSSSMDFAKENGFKTDDGAKKLYKNALGLI